MKCPHCIVEINPNFEQRYLGSDKENYWSVFHMNCPNPKCGKKIIDLASGQPNHNLSGLSKIDWRQAIRPFTSSRPPVPSEVETIFASDYNEACLILTLSPKASAALSRRCLQNILREKAGVKKEI